MKSLVKYCKSWFRAKKRPTEIWTVEQAQRAHSEKKLYTALVGSSEKPFCFLEINDKFVGVGFLDEKLRESLYYAFKEVEPGKLFLTMATYREFVNDTDVVALGTIYVFNQNGEVKIQESRISDNAVKTAESQIDVTDNYSSWPDFGEYDDLIRIERNVIEGHSRIQ